LFISIAAVRFDAMALPISLLARSVAASSIGASPPSACATACTMSVDGNCMSGRVVNVPGIAS
jgi:hypothetical protein